MILLAKLGQSAKWVRVPAQRHNSHAKQRKRAVTVTLIGGPLTDMIGGSKHKVQWAGMFAIIIVGTRLSSELCTCVPAYQGEKR